jgi:hypothetical protein
MCVNTFAITGHGPAAPVWVESYHSHLAATTADEEARMVTMVIIRVINDSG